MRTNPQDPYSELASLFFMTRQLIRSKLPYTSTDPNEWMRCETLRCLHSRSPAVTMREVADYLRVKAPSATSIISRMEREGLVRRSKETHDKRLVRISLTSKGEKRVHKYVSDASSTLENVFSKMPKKDVTTLTRILQSLQKAHRN